MVDMLLSERHPAKAGEDIYLIKTDSLGNVFAPTPKRQ
jgi:hypothetical protein